MIKKFFILFKSVLISIKEGIKSNPEIQELLKKYPRFFSFISRRFAKTNFFGLPLTLLTIAFIYVLFLFLGIIEGVIFSKTIVQIDLRAAALIAIFRSPAFVKIFLGITYLGKIEVVLFFLTISSIIFWLLNKKTFIYSLWLTVAGGEIFVFLGKLIFHRPRPATAVYSETSASFPSGHATVAVALYGFLIYFLLLRAKKRRHKLLLLFSGILLIFLIGFSRIYLGVHFVSDILAGYLTGLLWLIIGVSINQWQIFRHKNMPRPAPLPSKNLKYISACLILSALIFYITFSLLQNTPLKSPAIQEVNSLIVSKASDIFSNSQTSRYTETLFAANQEPLSFIITAPNDAGLIEKFEKSDWRLADRISISSLINLIKAAILNKEYAKAPMTPDFWNGQVNNFGFEKETVTHSVRQRHHARFWRTNIKTNDDKNIYVGTVSLDTNIKWLTVHQISPDIDTERELLFSDLSQKDNIKYSRKEKLVTPILGKNFAGDQFFTDGEAYFLELN